MNFARKWHKGLLYLKKIKAQRNFPLAELKLFSNAVILSILLYGSCAWTTVTEENVKRVFKLQKRASSVILDANVRSRRKDFIRQLDWLQKRTK